MPGKSAEPQAGAVAPKKIPPTGKVQVMDIFKLGGTIVSSGRVVEGAVKKGATGKLNGKPFTVSKIEANHSIVEVAETGMLAGFTIEGPGSSSVASGAILDVKN